ncbi:hypothetical protein HanOQP8_Chr10g0360051 [Helianthus annuus]|nr:hypothetical protein HanOQP8_Chr10g0360051 [Helianthus annuus]
MLTSYTSTSIPSPLGQRGGVYIGLSFILILTTTETVKLPVSCHSSSKTFSKFEPSTSWINRSVYIVLSFILFLALKST